MRPSDDTTCYIYLVVHKNPAGTICGPVKVGITTNMDRRLATLRTGNPRPIDIAAYFTTPNTLIARTLEDAFHDVYSEKRLAGEWFDIDPYDGLVGLCQNVESALRYFLGEDETLLDNALELSGVNKARFWIEEIHRIAKEQGKVLREDGEGTN